AWPPSQRLELELRRRLADLRYPRLPRQQRAEENDRDAMPRAASRRQPHFVDYGLEPWVRAQRSPTEIAVEPHEPVRAFPDAPRQPREGAVPLSQRRMHQRHRVRGYVLPPRQGVHAHKCRLRFPAPTEDPVHVPFGRHRGPPTPPRASRPVLRQPPG